MCLARDAKAEAKNQALLVREAIVLVEKQRDEAQMAEK